VASLAQEGRPIVAEGVGLPWLGRELDGRPMCGVLDAGAVTGEQTVAGYREATAPRTSSLAPAGARITGYKQHRAIVTPRGGAVPAWTWSSGSPEGFVWHQVHASQLGLHWAAAPEIAKRVVNAARTGMVAAGQPAKAVQPVQPRVVQPVQLQQPVPSESVPALPQAGQAGQSQSAAVSVPASALSRPGTLAVHRRSARTPSAERPTLPYALVQSPARQLPQRMPRSEPAAAPSVPLGVPSPAGPASAANSQAGPASAANSLAGPASAANSPAGHGSGDGAGWGGASDRAYADALNDTVDIPAH
jgi:cobyrinic acid a,c-diamide synthase